MAQGGPASDPSSVRSQLESTFAQPAGPVKLLLYFGSERSGEVMAKFMKAYGWGWQRISQKSPLKRVLHNAKRALEDHGHDQIIVCADGSHSEGAWARAAQQCNRTVHMLALHVADSLQIVAGPGEPHAPRLCIESISEDQGADLQLQNPKKGRYSAVMTADTPSQLQAALAYLCQHSQKQPTQPATQADGLIDYRQRPYAAVHFMNIVPSALDEGAGDEVSVDAFDREDHVEARDQDASHHRPAGKDGMHEGGDQQQPHIQHGGSRQARAGAGAHSHQVHHVQSNGWEGPHAAQWPFHQQHHRHIQQPQQQQQPQQHQPLGFGRGMQQSHAAQPFQTGPHAPRHNGRGPQMAGQWHMHPGGGMPQGGPGMGWGSPAPHNPDDWRQGPIPFHNFAPDDLLGPPWPGTASLLQNPAHPPHQSHHAHMPARMPGQYNTHGQLYSRQDTRVSSTDGGLRPTPITLQAPHGVRYPGRSQGQEGNLQNAMAYAPGSMYASGQPWASGSFLPENQPHAAYTHQQPYRMQMQPPGQHEHMPGQAGSAGKGKKHWKKEKTDAQADEGEAVIEDQGQALGKKHGKKHKLGQSVEGNGAESKEQSQVQKKQKLTRKQKRRERDREETADGDMLRWLETGLLPAWWSSARGPPSQSHPAVADVQPAIEGGMLRGAESAGDAVHASKSHADGHSGTVSNGNAAAEQPGAAQQDLPEKGRGPCAIPAARDAPHRDDCPPDDPIDLRPLLLFDLNGTLTAHTSVRKGSGRNEMRPGLHHLRRLQEHFRLGIFTSSSMRTVQAVIPLLEAAAGPGPRLFSRPELVLFRDHTLPAPAAHVEAGGNFWDTCKPLTKWFSRLHRTLLFDDDAYKAYSGEKGNMVLVPCWAEADAEDSCIAVIVDAVLEVLGPLGQNDDLRAHTPELTARITRSVQAIAQKEVQQMQEGELLPVC